jgi:hypothetical protein
LFKINNLHVYDGLVTDKLRLSALVGAVVEFRARAGTGFADD